MMNLIMVFIKICFFLFFLSDNSQPSEVNASIVLDPFQNKVKCAELKYLPRQEDNVFNILLDEGEDQTVPLQKQLDAVPDGTYEKPNIIKLPKGRFWTEGDLENNFRGQRGIINFRNRHNIIIEGYSKEEPTTLFTIAPATPYGGDVGKNNHSLRRHFWIIESSNIIVKNIQIEGSNRINGKIIGSSPKLTPSFWKGGHDTGSIGGAPAYKSYWEQEHAFDIRGCENVTLENINVFGVWGDGVYVGGTGIPSKNIIIKNSYLKFTGRQGIAAANNVDGLLIDNVHIDKGRRASIDLEPHSSDGYVKNVEIRNSKLHAVMTVIAALGKGEVNNIRVINNEFSGGSFVACGDSSKIPIMRENWVIKGNERTTGGYGSPQASSYFRNVKNIIFQGNNDKVSDVQSKATISFFNCEGEIIVRNNDFLGGEFILSLGNTEDLIIENNKPLQIVKRN